jgi:NADH-quinone oxidoreductase subunit C
MCIRCEYLSGDGAYARWVVGNGHDSAFSYPSGMTPVQVAGLISERFADRLISVHAEDKHPRVHIAVNHWRALAEFLRHNSALSFDWLANLSGVDYVADDQACVVYDLWSFDRGHRFAVKVFAARAEPTFPSMCDIWPAANWHEREAFDLLGFNFLGHPDLRRILLADDWDGHPLRKDYVFPTQYQGIPSNLES